MADSHKQSAVKRNGHNNTPCLNDGHTYNGSLVFEEIDGSGKYKWCDGVIYEGSFSGCIITGRGKYTWRDGSYYEGEVLNGLRHGVGDFHCAKNKTVYSGEWIEGKRHGNGRLIYDSTQTCYYDGHWVRNMKQGYGTERYKSGDIYMGEWYQNKRHGNGDMYWYSTNEAYSGQWEFGFQHGHGQHMWTVESSDNTQYPIRNMYNGEWKIGRREGGGSFYYANGTLLEIYWKNNRKIGHGRYISKDCGAFQCHFKDDNIGSVISGSILDASVEDVFRVTAEELHYIATETLTSDKVKTSQSVFMRYISQIKRIYSFYSSLGISLDPGENLILRRLQFSAFLRDIDISQYGLSIYDAEIMVPGFELYPEEAIHMKDFLQALMLITNVIYDNKIPFSTFLPSFLSTIFSDAGNIRGILFSIPQTQISEILGHQRDLWQIYNSMRKTEASVVQYRDVFFLFKECNIINEIFNSEEVMEYMSTNTPNFNTERKLSFLEFYELILRCSQSTNVKELQMKNKDCAKNILHVLLKDHLFTLL